MNDGILTNPDGKERLVHLAGTLTLPDGTTQTKRFAVTVLGTDARRLRAYSRTPTTAEAVNQPRWPAASIWR